MTDSFLLTHKHGEVGEPGEECRQVRRCTVCDGNGGARRIVGGHVKREGLPRVGCGSALAKRW